MLAWGGGDIWGVKKHTFLALFNCYCTLSESLILPVESLCIQSNQGNLPLEELRSSEGQQKGRRWLIKVCSVRAAAGEPAIYLFWCPYSSNETNLQKPGHVNFTTLSQNLHQTCGTTKSLVFILLMIGGRTKTNHKSKRWSLAGIQRKVIKLMWVSELLKHHQQV